MSHHQQPVIDRDDPARGPFVIRDHGLAHVGFAAGAVEDREQAAERAARASLRAQIARLEHECSAIVAERFPYIAAPVAPRAAAGGPSLLDLGELERSRDRLVAGVQELRARVAERAEHERRAREQLRLMKLDPGRYRFAKLPVKDLGQGGCGAWEVRPRLGLIGMLAGWWQLKLSSGCPLSRGSRSKRDPGSRR